MIKPLVAIVGRPNVGKSTFFNRIAGRRIAITDDTPGVTRDRIYADVDWGRHLFTLIDTGGIDPSEGDSMFLYMKEQAEIAIDNADVIVLMVDGKDGVSPDDLQVAEMLRITNKPVVVAVNKLDNPEKHDYAFEFYSLGIGNVIPISATLGIGINDILDEIVSYLPEPSDSTEQEQDELKIAVVGRPNVGKSSMVNAMLGQNRAIVSDIAGTTRDAIDTPLIHDNQRFLIIDTAGIRKKRSIKKDTIERFGVIRALAAIRRADVAVIVTDAVEGITEQDVKICGYVFEEGKPSILIVNKWDLVKKDTYTMDTYTKKIRSEIQFMQYMPVLFTSALTGQRVEKVFDLADHVYSQSQIRVSTGVLNEVLLQAVTASEPPSDKGKRLKISYATQVGITPPTFVLFVNDPELMHFSYKRYLENYLRKSFGFEGTPIRIILRKKEDNR